MGARSSGKRWNWDLFKERLRKLGEEEVTAAEQIMKWAEANNVTIDWSSSQRGGFVLCYYPEGFYPFIVTGDGTIEWNIPRQRDKSPRPFNQQVNRAEILKRLQSIKGVTVDLNNVYGYGGLRLPLRVIADKEAGDKFFAVCSWIQETLKG